VSMLTLRCEAAPLLHMPAIVSEWGARIDLMRVESSKDEAIG